MFFLRNRALAAPHFTASVRAFICQEMAGSKRRQSVSDAALAPLFDWLKTAIERSTLPPPHRFTVPWRKPRPLPVNGHNRDLRKDHTLRRELPGRLLIVNEHICDGC